MLKRRLFKVKCETLCLTVLASYYRITLQIIYKYSTALSIKLVCSTVEIQQKRCKYFKLPQENLKILDQFILCHFLQVPRSLTFS